MARCSLFGDDFISTFDESMYSFAGDCSYLLAGDCQKHSFSLIGESWALNGGRGSGSQLSSALACGGMKGRGGFLTTVPALEDPAESTVGNGLSITQGSSWLLRGSLSMEPGGMESLHASPVIVAIALGPGNTLGAQSIKRNDEVEGAL